MPSRLVRLAAYFGEMRPTSFYLSGPEEIARAYVTRLAIITVLLSNRASGTSDLGHCLSRQRTIHVLNTEPSHSPLAIKRA